MTDFTMSIDPDGVALITWDTKGRTMNVMNEQGFKDLDALIDTVLRDDAIKGAVITSGKKGSFAGGMDLNVIAKMKEMAGSTPARGLFDGIIGIHAILRKIERANMDPKTNKGGKPIAAALPGTALGIGLEIPLACHRIFVANLPSAKIGLPEIKVGIFPGAGGTTRISRKLGAMAAAPILLEGKLLNPKAAKAAGLIDEISDDPVGDAKKWVLQATDNDIIKPWDQKGYKFPGGAPYHPAGFMTFVGACAMINGKTQGVYPAAKALLSAVYEGALVPFDTALKIEARWFAHVLLNPTSSAMIRSLFINKEALEKGAVRPADIADQSVQKVGIIGAGMMGAGIAIASAGAGIQTVLIDTDQDTAERGKSYADAHFTKGVARGKITAGHKDRALSMITAGTDYDLLKDCDLVIEAVFEDPNIKSDVVKKVLSVIPPHCILATNTSTLPITHLAKASDKPDQFIGIHFFSPAEKMMLVEIIKAKDTQNRAVAKALDYVRQIRKTPIVVNDARFFYCNRCIIPYINEGIRMLREGVCPALIENAARMAGMPVGPLQLVDETSIELGIKIAKSTKQALKEAYQDGDIDDVLLWMADQNRLGRKNKAGFYHYDDTGKRLHLWEGLHQQYPPAAHQPDPIDVEHRLLMIQALEAVRAYEQGVLEDIREGDVGAILGWGFAPWSGGPFSWLDMIGADYAAARADELSNTYGVRFDAPALLKDIAASGDTFYGRAGLT